MTVLKGLLRSRTAAFGLGLTGVLALLAVFAPWVAPYRPDEIHPIDSLLPPSARYWLGTDDLGRDILSRIVYGARASLMVGAIAVGIAASVGIPLGLLAGYVGGRLDGLIMRLMDALLAFPAILLAIALMAVLGPSLQNAMVAIGIVFVPAFARITRANTLSIREKEFVEAARALGAGSVYIAAGVILPNCLSPLIVQGSLAVANAILVEAALSLPRAGGPAAGSLLGLHALLRAEPAQPGALVRDVRRPLDLRHRARRSTSWGTGSARRSIPVSAWRSAAREPRRRNPTGTRVTSLTQEDLHHDRHATHPRHPRVQRHAPQPTGICSASRARAASPWPASPSSPAPGRSPRPPSRAARCGSTWRPTSSSSIPTWSRPGTTTARGSRCSPA